MCSGGGGSTLCPVKVFLGAFVLSPIQELLTQTPRGFFKVLWANLMFERNATSATVQTRSLTGFPSIRELVETLDGPVIRNANHRAFARIDSQKKTPSFITCERFARVASTCDSQFLALRSAIRENLGFSSQEPLNAPSLINGLLSSGFSRGKTAP